MSSPASRSVIRRLVALDFDELSDRELFASGVGLLLLLSIAAWMALNVLQPPAQTQLSLSGGPASGAYHLRAQRISAALARNGVKADVAMSKGSLENIARLQAAGPGHADAAFVQGGLVDFEKTPELESVARLGYEVVWIFHAHGAKWATLSALRGRRLGIGPAGSGTQPVARALLQAVDVDAAHATLLELGNEEALTALKSGRIDAFFAVAAPSAPFIQRAIAEGAQVLGLSQDASLANRLPWLTPLVLPRGSLSLVQDLPHADTHVVAVRTELVVRAGLHPSTKTLLRRLVLDDQRAEGPSPLMRMASLQPADPLAAEAKVEVPFLQRYLPFWWAQLLYRMSISILPVGLLTVSSLHALIDFRRRRTHLKIVRLFAQAKDMQLRMAEEGFLSRGGQQRLAELEQQLARLSPRVTSLVEYYRVRSVLAAIRRDSKPQPATAGAPPKRPPSLDFDADDDGRGLPRPAAVPDRLRHLAAVPRRGG